MGDEASGQHAYQSRPVVHLHPNHQRTLTALLTQIAATIARYETWTNDRLEERLTFAKRPDDLTDGERHALHDTALELVREANHLAELFNLETQNASLRAALGGQRAKASGWLWNCLTRGACSSGTRNQTPRPLEHTVGKAGVRPGRGFGHESRNRRWR